MRLAAVSIRGFKSFADAVSFKVDGSLIGVVGPNGCGKSNIVDAIRWALGESRASSLRGASLPDVLFNGSGKRPPADYCEVELRFDNAAGNAPAIWKSHPQIVARRELWRDGRQAFRINGNAVRRRDVIDLFRGTGVSPRAYGVIEQGMITHIAESSADELRAFMEEAAGVSLYKERRRESERRLQGARDNLEQAAIVVDGLQKRVGALNRQAKKAQKYKAYSDDINALEALALAEKQQTAKAQLEEQRAQLQALEAQTEALRQQTAALGEAQAQKKRRRAGLQEATEEAQRRLSAAQAQAAAAERDMQNAAAGRARAQSQIDEAQNEASAIGKQMDELRAQSKQWRGEAETAQQKAGKTDGAQQATELLRLQERQTELQGGLDFAREALAAARQEKEAATVKRDMLAEFFAAVGERIAAAERALAELPPATAAAAADLSAARERAEAMRGEWQQSQTATAELQKQLREEETALRERESQIAALRAEEGALQAMANEDAGGENAPQLTRLAQALQANAGEWGRALDAALGEYATAVATPNLDEFERQNKLPGIGVAVVELPPQADGEASAGVAEEGEGGAATRVGLPPLLGKISAPAASQRVLAPWLRGVFAAPTLPAAMAARAKLQDGEKIVTAAGQVVMLRSYLARGEARGGYNWEQRMRDLRAQGEAQQNAAQAAAQALAKLQNKLQAAQAEEARLLARAEEARQKLAEQEIENSRLQERHEADMRRRQELAEGKAKMEGERAQNEAAQKQTEAALAKLISAEAEATARFNAAQQQAQKQTDALQQAREKAEAEAETRLAGERQQADLQNRLAGAAARLEELTARRAAAQELAAKRRRELEGASDAALQAQQNESRQKAQAAERALAQEREKLRQSESEEEELEKKGDALRAQREKLQEGIADKRVRERELAMTLNYCVDSLEEFAISGERLEELRREHEGETSEQWTQAAADLRQKRENLGPLNFAADSELRENEERLQETEKQKADIEQAIAELAATVRRINEEARELLQKFYDGINREVAAMFAQLFGGGEAELRLLGDSILEGDFELRARPPGKKLFPMRSLSGGEKAAAAAAFVFAILKLNPPPFCVLDEVDAPLDDSRADRFADALEGIAAKVQCLVITHNKGTVSRMPKLVGVTQEEAGVSKVVTAAIDGLQTGGGA